MDITAQKSFLSEDNLKLHLSHLSELRLRYSIFKKSAPTLVGKTLRQVMNMHSSDGLKNEILPLINSIKSHELYFSSFSSEPRNCKEIKSYFSSDSAFLYELYRAAREYSYGFLYVGRDRGGKPEVAFGDGSTLPKLYSPPYLVLDLYEHVYFLDYAYSKEKFLRAMLSHLDISKLFSGENANTYLDTEV